MKQKKKYLAAEKRYVTQEEYDTYHKKRSSDVCRGGKPHDWHDSLPYGVSHANPTPEIIDMYYTKEEELCRYKEEHEEHMKALGFEQRYYRFLSSRCGKEKRRQLCHRCGKNKGW